MPGGSDAENIVREMKKVKVEKPLKSISKIYGSAVQRRSLYMRQSTVCSQNVLIFQDVNKN